jgi:hypothetical protein
VRVLAVLLVVITVGIQGTLLLGSQEEQDASALFATPVTAPPRQAAENQDVPASRVGAVVKMNAMTDSIGGTATTDAQEAPSVPAVQPITALGGMAEEGLHDAHKDAQSKMRALMDSINGNAVVSTDAKEAPPSVPTVQSTVDGKETPAAGIWDAYLKVTVALYAPAC